MFTVHILWAMRPEVSIILPTYNEANNIPLILEKIDGVLQSNSIIGEIIVADDNSPDETWRIAEDLIHQYSRLRVLRRLENKGLSPAVMDGFRSAAGKYIIVMDADMQHDEKVLPKFIKKFQEGAEIVIGTRKGDGGGVDGWSKKRLFISNGATLLAKWFGFKNATDPMSGYFGVTKEFFNSIAEQINPRGFKILLEFLARAKDRRVEEVGYVFRPRLYGESKLTGSIMLQYILGLYDLRFGKIIPIRFVKYGIVGVSGVLVNQLGLYLGRNILSLSNDLALILGIEISILSNFIFNNYFTFHDRRKSDFKGIIAALFLFHLISSVGALINYAIAILFSKNFSWNIYWANLFGITIATVWNFVLNLHWTWREKK